MNSSQLPSLPKKKRAAQHHLVSVSVEDKLVKDRLNKQHLKVEQEIKKYDEILKRNKNLRQQYEPKRREAYRHANNENHNSSLVERSMEIASSGKDLIKIHGVKLDNRNLDLRRGARPVAHHDSSILDHRPGNNRLPALGKLSSQAKGLLAKYSRLR